MALDFVICAYLLNYYRKFESATYKNSPPVPQIYIGTVLFTLIPLGANGIIGKTAGD